MGDLRHQILLARGSTSNVNNKKSNLSYGEPLFDREMNYLYIGQKNSGANNPITSDRVWGKINNIEYSFNADSTGAYIKSNTLQFDVKDTSNNNILSATNSNLIFKGDLKSGDKIIYTSNTDTLTVTDISSRSGGTLSNFGIITGNRNITAGTGTISTSANVTTPKISGVNNTLSIDATSSVSFNGNITATDKTITAKTFIGEYETGDDTLSINKWSNTAQGKTILRVKGNSFLYYESLLGVIAKPQTIVNSDIGVETLTSSSKNYIVGFGLDTKDKNINAGTGSVTAAKFIGNLDGTSTYADYASSDKSKGTIEQRLTNLGFKQGTISVDGSLITRVTKNYLYRQGNYVIGHFSCTGGDFLQSTSTGNTLKIGTITSEFIPNSSENVVINGGLVYTIFDSTNYNMNAIQCIILNSEVYLQLVAIHGTTFSWDKISSTPKLDIVFGYEALPLK